MTTILNEIRIKRTADNARRPEPADLLAGELALNYSGGEPGLYFKDSLNTIRKIGPCVVSEAPPVPDEGTTFGSGEFWYKPSLRQLFVWVGGWVLISGGGRGEDGPPLTQLTANANGLVQWSAATGPYYALTLTANAIIDAPLDLKAGDYLFFIKQDTVGERTVTWNGVFKFGPGGVPLLSEQPNKVDLLRFLSDGTSLFFESIKEF